MTIFNHIPSCSSRRILSKAMKFFIIALTLAITVSGQTTNTVTKASGVNNSTSPNNGTIDPCSLNSSFSGGVFQLSPSGGSPCRCNITNSGPNVLQMSIGIRVKSLNVNASQFRCQPFVHYHLNAMKYEICSAKMSSDYYNASLMTSLNSGNTVFLDLFDTSSIGTIFGINLKFSDTGLNYNVTCSSSLITSSVTCPCPVTSVNVTTGNTTIAPFIPINKGSITKSQRILIGCCCGFLCILLIAAIISGICYVRSKKAKSQAREDNLDGRQSKNYPPVNKTFNAPKPKPTTKDSTLSAINHLLERLIRIATNKERDITFSSEDENKKRNSSPSKEFRLSSNEPVDQLNANTTIEVLRNTADVHGNQEFQPHSLPMHQSSPNMTSDLAGAISRDSGFTTEPELHSNCNSDPSMQYNSTQNYNKNNINNNNNNNHNNNNKRNNNNVYASDGYATANPYNNPPVGGGTYQRRTSRDSSSMAGSSVFAAEPCYSPDGRRAAVGGSRYASVNSVQDMAVNGRRPLTPPLAQRQLPPLSLSERRKSNPIKDGPPIYAQPDRKSSVKLQPSRQSNSRHGSQTQYDPHYNPSSNIDSTEARHQQQNVQISGQGEPQTFHVYQQGQPQQDVPPHEDLMHSPQYQKEFSEHQQRLQNINNQALQTADNTHIGQMGSIQLNNEIYIPLSQVNNKQLGAPLAGIETNI